MFIFSQCLILTWPMTLRLICSDSGFTSCIIPCYKLATILFSQYTRSTCQLSIFYLIFFWHFVFPLKSMSKSSHWKSETLKGNKRKRISKHDEQRASWDCLEPALLRQNNLSQIYNLVPRVFMVTASFTAKTCGREF